MAVGLGSGLLLIYAVVAELNVSSVARRRGGGRPHLAPR